VNDDIEHRLSELFEDAAARLDPPIEEILRTSTALGRRRLRRRGIATTAAAVAVVGLTAGTVLGVTRVASPDPPDRFGTAAKPSAPLEASPIPKPGNPTDNPTGTSPAGAPGTSPGTAPASAASTVPRSGKALLQQLLAAYGGHTIGDAPNPFGLADIVDDDGHGDAEVSITVEKLNPAMLADHAFTCATFDAIDEADSVPRPAGVLPPKCTHTTTSAGRPEYLTVTSNDASGFYDYEVTLFVTDDLVVSLEAGNGVPHATTVDVTRASPPFTLAQMQAVVADPAWPDFVAMQAVVADPAWPDFVAS
jgi:hypothetical protein